MRILMLSQFFYPPTVGGEERFVTDLSHELAARGHDVSVATLWQKGYPEFEVDQGVRVHRLRGTMQKASFLFSDGDRTYSPPFPDPGMIRELRRVIREERPEIVHAHNWLLHSFTPLKTWSKAKFLISLHDYSHACIQKRLMRQGKQCSGPAPGKCLKCGTQFYGLKGPVTVTANFYWAARARHAADMFLPVSQTVAEGNLLDVYRAPYQIMSNFVPDDSETLDDDNHPLLSQLPAGDFMLFVGDLTRDKGVEVLLRAYTEVKTQVPLVMIGRSSLIKLDDMLPHNALVLGSWPHNAVMGAWRRSLIGLVPSTWSEPFGIVALEAMYMGKPLIASRAGALPDIVVDGQTGLLVPPDDHYALATAMQSLLADPERRAQMGAQARLRSLQFLASAVVARFEDVYQQLLTTASVETDGLSMNGSR